MATTVDSEVQASTAPPISDRVAAGVAPLRTGQGHEFLLRRLHSLTGIVPVGTFLLEHILFSNAFAMQGPAAYAKQVRFLGSLPLVLVLEAVGIWLPILFHGLYGIYIWYKASPNLLSYRFAGNWFYSLQRWTGVIAFAYILWHTYTMRFTGIDLHMFPGASFGKVQNELFETGDLLFYIVGLLAAAWHFAYGVWLFAAKWGLVTGEQARKRFFVICFGLFLVISGVGLSTIYSFRYRFDRQPADEQHSRQIEQMQPEETAKPRK